MKTLQIALRLPADLVERIDETTVRLETLANGVKVTRSDTIRFLVRNGLATEVLDVKDVEVKEVVVQGKAKRSKKKGRRS